MSRRIETGSNQRVGIDLPLIPLFLDLGVLKLNPEINVRPPASPLQGLGRNDLQGLLFQPGTLYSTGA